MASITELMENAEHRTLTDGAGPHCRCGWIPRTADPRRAHAAVNAHVTRENRKAATWPQTVGDVLGAAGYARPVTSTDELESAHAEALEEDAAHDAAVAAAQPLVPDGTPEPVRTLAERLVQGVPMFDGRDLDAQPLTKEESAQMGAAVDLASSWLRRTSPVRSAALPIHLRNRDRLERSLRLIIPPGASA